MRIKKYNTESNVEKIFLEKSGYEFIYPPTEKIKSIVVENFPLLGKLTALRFIEWVQKNPGGVVSLPTGKTPEYFIKWTKYYLKNWDKKEVREELEGYGIEPSLYPDMKSLYFVQIDEFYPILPTHQNSFYYYVKKFYIKGFGFDEKKALLIDTSREGIPEGRTVEDIFPDWIVDLSLRFRHPKTYLENLQKQAIHAVDEFCARYEERIRELGGIGFFLGGIGPDGHIGFNVKGSDFFSTTRLTPINYETAAAAATDLGGIEISRKRLVITIGLSTITYRKDVVPIIFAAGEAKAKIVANSIQSPKTIMYPASVLQEVENSRFYLTKGAASKLIERIYVDLCKKEQITDYDIKFHIINFSVNNNKRIKDNSEKELKRDRFIKEVLKKSGKTTQELLDYVEKSLIENLNRGLEKKKNQRILHTSPHHDDEILGYLPYIVHLIREPSNIHFFAYMTGGFTSVSNKYMLSLCKKLEYYLEGGYFKALLENDYFLPGNITAKKDDVYLFLDGLASNKLHLQDEAISRRLLRILVEVFDETDPENLKNRNLELINYFKTQYPGKKDLPHIQKIKAMIREWEAELVWGYFGFDLSSIFHLRLSFYTGDIFTKQPEFQSDVVPVLNLLRKTKPSIVTVAFDPEGSGPDTHYKVLQTISEALKIYEKETGNSDIKVWGYRNVWYRFHPAEVNMFIPVSLNSIAILNNVFLNCFGSQRDASFPSYEFDGPFSYLAQKIMVEQYEMIKNCLGQDYFYNNSHPRIRATRGLVFLKEMSLKEFYNYAAELKKIIEE